MLTTLCGTSSEFFQVTTLPAFTFVDYGLKEKLSILIAAVDIFSFPFDVTELSAASVESTAASVWLPGIKFTCVMPNTPRSSSARTFMSDQHTVKPWFNGKLDFAPVVKDLSELGFPLTGGRLDYIDSRSVAALVYKHRQHTINLFLWPSSDADSGPHDLTSKGYNLVFGTRSHMTYWAVSDLNANELAEFVREVEK